MSSIEEPVYVKDSSLVAVALYILSELSFPVAWRCVIEIPWQFHGKCFNENGFHRKQDKQLAQDTALNKTVAYAMVKTGC